MRFMIIAAAAILAVTSIPADAQPSANAPFACETLVHRQTLGGSPPITARVLKQTYAPGKPPLMHRHKVGEVIYVLSGTGTNTMNGKTTALTPDRALIVPAGTDHAVAGTGSAGVTVISVQISDTKSPWFKTRNSNKPPKACRD
jgi:quercetin dioxygenase-like cupin family protein